MDTNDPVEYIYKWRSRQQQLICFRDDYIIYFLLQMDYMKSEWPARVGLEDQTAQWPPDVFWSRHSICTKCTYTVFLGDLTKNNLYLQ
jgi:hypothetical protein